MSSLSWKLQETKKGGKALVAEVEIKSHGRKIRDWINVQNANPTAVEVGMDRLNDLILSCGLTEIREDTDELLERPCLVRLGIDGSYNNIKRYLVPGAKVASDMNDELPI